MKITLYTITDCEFCKEEKEYLQSHNLPFEEKNLEKNKAWLTEMLAVSNNFAGTPVTKIEKDDGTTAVLKGFTKDEFDQTLGLSQPATPTPPPAVEPEPPKAEISTPPAPPPVEKTPEVPPAEVPIPPATETPTPPPIPAPAPSEPQVIQKNMKETNDALASILQDLQAKSTTAPAGPATPSMTGAVPHPDSEPAPAIPDFQK